MITYADKPWIKFYDPHVPASLKPYPEHALHDFLRDTAKKHSEQVALITTVKIPLLGRQTNTINYNQLHRFSDALACALIDNGLKKGDKVALVMPNCTAFAISYYAILKAGGVVSATNPTYPPKRMQYQIDDCDAQIVITLSLFYETINQIRSETKIKTVIVTNIKEYMPPAAKFLFTMTREKSDGHRVETLQPHDYIFQDLLTQYDNQTPNVDVTPDDLALIQYTGGTTGVSKGAIATHRALVTNTIQLQTWANITGGQFVIPAHEIIFLGALPMFHVYGLIAMLSQAVAAGGKVVLIPNPRDIDEVVDVIGHYKPNVFLGVPALYNAINNHPKITSGKISLKSFLFNSSASAPLPPKTKEQYEQLSDSIISEGFGMSELPVATHSNPAFGETRINSVGIPFPDVDVRIVSLEDGQTVMPVGEIGELVICSPNMMKGYHKLPTETANTIRELEDKNWLFTGDIAYMDNDGYFYLVDRKKDMALIGGYNVYPTTVEKAIKDHPAVLEVGVAAIPHPTKQGQETLKAWIVLKPEQTITEEELITHCEQYLAPYEIPRRFGFIDELPKTTVGKTLRRELIKLESTDIN